MKVIGGFIYYYKKTNHKSWRYNNRKFLKYYCKILDKVYNIYY